MNATETEYLNVMRRIVRLIANVNCYIDRETADRRDKLESMLPVDRAEKIAEMAYYD